MNSQTPMVPVDILLVKDNPSDVLLIKDGIQVLKEMKADERLKRIPVVVLTSSKSEEDILKCNGLQASCFVTKPRDLSELERAARVIEEFWFSIVRYPGKEGGVPCSP